MILSVSVSFAQTDSTASRSLTRVVAEVNHQTISYGRIQAELTRYFSSEFSLFPETTQRELRKQILDRMIERELLLQAVSQEKILPTEPSVQDAISVYLEQKVFQNIIINEDMLRASYESEIERFFVPEEVRAKHIFFRVPSESSTTTMDEIFKRASQVLVEAKASAANFSELVRVYSEGPNQVKGGDLGYFTREQMPKEFSDAAFNLKPGELSDIVRTNLGFHIIRVEELRGGETLPYEKVREKLYQELLAREKNKALDAKLAELRRNARVIIYTS